MIIKELIEELQKAAAILGEFAPVGCLTSGRLVPINFTQIGGAYFVLWLEVPAKKPKRKTVATALPKATRQ